MSDNIQMTQNVRISVSFLLIMFLTAACTPTVVSVNAYQSDDFNRPEWVKSKPTSSTYYIGIGYSDKASSGNYTQVAKKNALDDLVSEISVNISSVSVLNKIEDQQSISEQYKSMIKTSVSDQIEDYQLVESWEDDTKYWVYYRLSIAQYKKRKAEKKRNAIALAKDSYINGKKAIKTGNITSGMTSLINGIYTLAPYLAHSNKVKVEGKEILLGNSLFDELQSTLDRITIRTQQNQYSVSRRLNKDLTITSSVKLDAKKLVSELPLKASFTVGQGNVRSHYTTDDKGSASVLISSIRSKEAKQVVTITPDISKLETNEDRKKKYGLLLKSIQLPSKDIILAVKKPIVYLETNEKILGEISSEKIIAASLRKALTEEGFVLGRIKEKANLWIEVSSDTQKGKAKGSIFVTYLNLSINVTDMNTGVEVHHASIDRLKAYSLDYERSSKSGYTKAVEKLEKETLPNLIENMLE